MHFKYSLVGLGLLVMISLTGCGSKYHNAINTQDIDRDVPSVVGSTFSSVFKHPRDIIFSIDETSILIVKGLKNIDKNNIEHINKLNEKNKKDNLLAAYGCVRINENKVFEQCSNEVNARAFEVSKIDASGVFATILTAPAVILVSLSNPSIVKDSTTKTKVDQDVINSIGNTINAQIYNEYTKYVTEENIEGLEEFVKNYSIDSSEDPAFRVLTSMYRGEKTFEGYLRAYKREKDSTDAENAYMLAKSDKDLNALMIELNNNDKSLADTIEKNLLARYASSDTFDGYIEAYKLSGESKYGKKALLLAKTSDQKSLLEFEACKRLKNKENLFQIGLKQLSFKMNKGSYFANQKVLATIELKPNMTSVLVPKYSKYKVVIEAKFTAPLERHRRSFWMGNIDEDFTRGVSKIEEINFQSGEMEKKIELEATLEDVAVFHRGIAGGYTTHWPTGDTKFIAKIKNVECVE